MGFVSIQHYVQRIKRRYRAGISHLRVHIASETAGHVLQALILTLVGLSSFFLGRLSGQESSHAQILKDVSHRIVYLEPSNDLSEASKPRGKVVASKNGKRYHYPWCKGASTIADKNKRWFQSEADAEKAGYTLASNCK